MRSFSARIFVSKEGEDCRPRNHNTTADAHRPNVSATDGLVGAVTPYPHESSELDDRQDVGEGIEAQGISLGSLLILHPFDLIVRALFNSCGSHKQTCTGTA
jgi:hypothetical protein